MAACMLFSRCCNQLAGRPRSAARPAPAGPAHFSCRSLCTSITRHGRVPRRLPATAAGAFAGGSDGGSGSHGGSSGGGSGSSGSSGSSGEPHPLRNWTFLYAAFLAAGGVMAYVKAGSTKSLTTAGGCALILALSGRKMVGAAARVNLGVAAAIAALLSVVMCSRYARTRKLMPAGITAAASVCMTAAYINGLFQ